MCLRSRCEHSHISTCTCAKHCFNEFYYTIFRVDLLFCGYCWTTDHFNNIHITSYYQIWSDLLNSVESICPVYPDLRSVSFVANEKRWTTLIQSREGSHASGIPMKYAQLSFFTDCRTFSLCSHIQSSFSSLHAITQKIDRTENRFFARTVIQLIERVDKVFFGFSVFIPFLQMHSTWIFFLFRCAFSGPRRITKIYLSFSY